MPELLTPWVCRLLAAIRSRRCYCTYCGGKLSDVREVAAGMHLTPNTERCEKDASYLQIGP